MSSLPCSSHALLGSSLLLHFPTKGNVCHNLCLKGACKKGLREFLVYDSFKIKGSFQLKPCISAVT